MAQHRAGREPGTGDPAPAARIWSWRTRKLHASAAIRVERHAIADWKSAGAAFDDRDPKHGRSHSRLGHGPAREAYDPACGGPRDDLGVRVVSDGIATRGT